jgi:hypothetical protein
MHACNQVIKTFLLHTTQKGERKTQGESAEAILGDQSASEVRNRKGTLWVWLGY